MILLWLLAALLTTGGAWAGARVARVYLGRTVDEALGDAGAYDAILHWRSETAFQSLSEAEELLAAAYPGVRLHRGPEVVGNANLFVALPESARTAAGLEELPQAVRELPGYNGITYLVEPSIDLAGVPPGLEEELTRQVAAIPGVAFVFWHGTTLTAVLEGAGQLPEVSRRLEELVEAQSLVEVILAQEGPADAQALADRLTAGTGLPFHPLGESAEGAHLAGAVARLGQLLPLLREETGLKAAFGQTAQELRQLAQAVAEGQGAARSAIQAGQETTAQIQTALHQVESLQARIDQLAQELASPQGRSTTLGLLAQILMENLVGGTAQAAPGRPATREGAEDPLAAVEALDGEGLAAFQGELETLQASLEAMDPAALEAAAGRLEAAMDRLPELTDQEVEELAGLLAQWGSDLGESGERLAFLVTGPVAAEALTQRIEDALGDEQQGVRVLPPAAVRPSPRASLMQMLHQAQGLVAGLLVIGLGGAHLLLDLSVIRQGARTLGRLQPRRPAGRQGTRPLRRWSRGGFDGTWWLAMVWGGSLLTVAATLSGAQLPWVDGKGTFLLGAVLALLAWALAGRINPVRAEEVELAVAAGLTPVQVMEAVILPEARPSLLGLMTRNGRLLEGPGDPRRPFWARLGETIRGRRRIHGDGHGAGPGRP